MIFAYNYIVKLANYLVKLQISACCLYFCLIKFTSDTGRYMNENLAFNTFIELYFIILDDFLFAENSTIEWQCLSVHTRIHNVNIL